MSYNIPKEVNDICVGDWQVGLTKRIKHLYREDGSECSVNKDAAMSILRKADGWWFYCFRCGASGFKSDDTKTPEEAEAALKALTQQIKYESVVKIELPNDFKKLGTGEERPREVPQIAYNWLWKYNITCKIFSKFDVGWSDAYQRCIIPIYDYFSTENMMQKKLVGWIGRDCRNIAKDERSRTGAAKYITKKEKGYSRILFHAPYRSNTYVIVEDVLSAMKINHYAKVNTIALLNTYVPPDLLLKLKDKRVILWLDEDQLANMVAVEIRGSCFGCDISHIHTTHDPKTYNEFFIQQSIKRR